MTLKVIDSVRLGVLAPVHSRLPNWYQAVRYGGSTAFKCFMK